METGTMTFPRTRQGLRNLDAAPRDLLPVSGGPVSSGQVNVSETGRWMSAVGGAALTVYGLGRTDLAGLGLALAGGALLYRGVTGHCHLLGALGLSTAGARLDANREVVYHAR